MSGSANGGTAGGLFPSVTPYDPLILSAAQQYGVPPQVLWWQINQESSFNPLAQTGNAQGLAQIMPGTASAPGYGIAPVTDPFDPSQAINFAAQYDAALYQKTGSWTGALTAYGTLAGVPASVTSSWNNLLGSNGIPDSGGSASGGDSLWSQVWSFLTGGALPGGGAGNAAGALSQLLTGGTSAAAPGDTGATPPALFAFVGELGARFLLGLVGIVLMFAGFYVAGQQAGFVTQATERREDRRKGKGDGLANVAEAVGEI